MLEAIRIFIIDPDPLARKILTEVLSVRKELAVLGAAATPAIAERHCANLNPQILVVDPGLPLEPTLRSLKMFCENRRLSTVFYTALKSSALIRIGSLNSQDGQKIIEKPDCGLASGIAKDADLLVNEILSLSKLRARTAVTYDLAPGQIRTATPRFAKNSGPIASTRCRVIAIGASTGGTQALQDLLQNLSVGAPGIVVVQHMPADFTGAFAQRLNETCNFRVKEAVGGEKIEPGVVLIARGDMHLVVLGSAEQMFVALKEGPKVCGHRPSVDVLFSSVAKAACPGAIGILLTGMGEDGAKGLLDIRMAGGRTLAQDEHSSAVFGMPRAAFLKHATDELVPISKMAERIMEILNESN